MTARPLAVSLLAAVVVAVAAVPPAGTENYGTTRREARRVERQIHAWFDRAGAGGLMTCIANRESGFNSRAYNDDDAWLGQSVAGLFQIKWPLWTPANPDVRAQPRRYRWVIRFWRGARPSWPVFRARLADPVQSIRLAWLLYRHEGAGAWGGGC